MSSKVKRLAAAAAVCVLPLVTAASSSAASRRPVLKITSAHSNCARVHYELELIMNVKASDLIVGHMYVLGGTFPHESDSLMTDFNGGYAGMLKAKHATVTIKHVEANPPYVGDVFPRYKFTVTWTLYDYGVKSKATHPIASRPVKTVIAACK